MCWLEREKKRRHGVVCKKKINTNFCNVPNNQEVDFLGETPLQEQEEKEVWTIWTARSPSSQTATERRREKTKQSNKGRGTCSQEQLKHGAIDTRSNNCGAVSNEDRLPVSWGVASPREPAFSSSFLLSWNKPIMSVEELYFHWRKTVFLTLIRLFSPPPPREIRPSNSILNSKRDQKHLQVLWGGSEIWESED